MNTKEAIRLVEDNLRLYKEDRDPIIELLQQGEKYRQMWEDFKTINREYFSNFEIRADYIIRMEELEQKYFPKEES